jgi:hypothetical protein
LKEVKEKQDLVVALNEEKRCLTHDLRRKLKEIEREKSEFQEAPTKLIFHLTIRKGSADYGASSESTTAQEISRIDSKTLLLNEKGSENKQRTESICSEQDITPIISQWHTEIDPKLALLLRDKELYDFQSKSIMYQITLLTVKLNEAKKRINECNVEL